MNLRTMILVFVGLNVCDALAKSVSLNWESIEDAVRYELVIERAGAPVRSETVIGTKWTGELAPGFHAYRIRGIDSIARPGEWSDPYPIVVMPEAITTQNPKNAEQLTIYSGDTLIFSWSGSKEFKNYEFELMSEGKTIYKSSVEKPELHLGQIPTGKYQWRVRGAIKPDENYAGLAGKTWFSQYSTTSNFYLANNDLEKPLLKYPIGSLWPTSDGKVEFQWERANGANAYEIHIRALDQLPNTQSFGEKMFTTEDTKIPVYIGNQGHFTWSVKSLAKPIYGGKEEKVEKLPSRELKDSPAESRAEFNFQTSDLSIPAKAEVSVETGIKSIYLRSTNSALNFDGNTSTPAWPLSANYRKWISSEWGFEGSFNSLSYQIDGTTHEFFGLGFTGLYQHYLGTGWDFRISLGAYATQFPELSPQQGGGSSFLKPVTAAGIRESVQVDKIINARLQVSGIVGLSNHFWSLQGDRVSAGNLSNFIENGWLGSYLTYSASFSRSYRVGIEWERFNVHQDVSGVSNQQTVMNSLGLTVGFEYRFGGGH